MKGIGVGVIGTGFMGKAHSVAYSGSASVFGTGLRPRLEIVCDLSPKRASQRATDLGFSRYTSSWQDVVNDPEVKLVSVCTPNDTHAEIAIAALKLGKSVWCEKPMSSNLPDSKKMLAASKKSKGKTIIGYNYTKRPWSWRMSRKASGTGANGDILSHVISVAHFLVGSTISKVVGDINIVHLKRKDPTNRKQTKTVDNDDMISALIHFQNGVHGHIGASRVTWGKKCGLTWEVHGTEGTIIFDQERLNEIKLFTRQKKKSTDGFRTILTGPDHPFYKSFLPNGGHSLGFMDVKMCELQMLLFAIEHDTETWPNFESGYEIEKVMDAVDRSALSGKWIKI